MNRGCWKVDENDQAIYIDLEEDDKDDEEDKEYSSWHELPDLLLEKIFSHLSIRQKYYASLVCKSWNRAFYLPYVWSQFVLEDNTLTRGRFNYYSGWQYVLDHMRTQMCLSQVGRNFKRLTFEPMFNFYNLYEFMNMVSWYSEQSQKSSSEEFAVGKRVRCLKFTFPCNMTSRDDIERIRLFGTGGRLLAALKRLMGNLRELERLELIDLMLDPNEAQNLLDGVCDTRCMHLRTLMVVNTTRVQYQLLHVGVFLNLRVLIISPQNLGDDVIELLGQTKLKHLHILQNRYTPNDASIKSVSYNTWKECRKNNPGLQVHLQVESKKYKTVVWQRGAPVTTVLYDSPHIGLQTDGVEAVIEYYPRTMRIFGHKSIPRFYRSKSFHHRIDEKLLSLLQECKYLTTLVVTERISTATALLLASTGKNLKNLIIRGNAVIIKCDWQKSFDWSNEFYDWLKINSKSYNAVEKEISRILERKWKFLSDKEFRNLNVDLHSDC